MQSLLLTFAITLNLIIMKPTHQRTNAPTHQLTNSPTHQLTNSPTHQLN
ncbi:MAG: PT domain-containing protein [Chitinophagales bacterium]|nr:PT domain-containing protein [Chitinophagales bacterium]